MPLRRFQIRWQDSRAAVDTSVPAAVSAAGAEE